MPQDLPPAGGYEPVQYKKSPRKRVPPSRDALRGRGRDDIWVLEGREGNTRAEVDIAFGCTGNYSAGLEWMDTMADVWDSELAREKMWSRIHLIPLLTAEEDRDLVRRHLADQAREKELLGSTTSAYNSDRYVRPTFAITPTKISK
ncbi:hypothetical protein D0Z07_7326 [Hyphodiscus hymeniophilus]|uniref:Uncharacterized protein n=1 Tax=Hyphodiscus hymeniophilus TaxID=353542 RepID=A0A9P7AV88_9HELO|nr:hypothetical protein D0Z07_7326 [Hyphodiscus hymeniophilus]